MSQTIWRSPYASGGSEDAPKAAARRVYEAAAKLQAAIDDASQLGLYAEVRGNVFDVAPAESAIKVMVFVPEMVVESA